MSPVTQLKKSRAQWKGKAVPRATQLREARKEIRRVKKSESTSRREKKELAIDLEKAKCQIATISEERDRAKNELELFRKEVESFTPHELTIDQNAQFRNLCVMLVVGGIVSFRAIPRILAILMACGRMPEYWIPHFTSVIHWVLRAGVSRMKAVTTCEAPWIAIMDCTIDIGVRKALVVLRVPLSALQGDGRAISHEDCECIGIKVSRQWNGKSVKQALTEFFNKAGNPAAILKDGGSDLKKGVRLCLEEFDSKRAWIIDDVGHMIANALKAEFANRAAFKQFINILKRGSARIRQTELANLLPPKIRAKGRFQSITPVAVWAKKMLSLIGGAGRAENESQLAKLRKAFHGLAQLRPFIETFAATALLTDEFLQLMKQRGLNQNSYLQAMAIFDQLPERSEVRIRGVDWLNRHLNIQCRMSIGQQGLLVSSDAIESIFGKFKVVIQRNPGGELNRLVYAIPLLCGSLTQEQIHNALNDCSQQEMLDYVETTLPPTLRQQRNKILKSEVDERVKNREI